MNHNFNVKVNGLSEKHLFLLNSKHKTSFRDRLYLAWEFPNKNLVLLIIMLDY